MFSSFNKDFNDFNTSLYLEDASFRVMESLSSKISKRLFLFSVVNDDNFSSSFIDVCKKPDLYKNVFISLIFIFMSFLLFI